MKRTIEKKEIEVGFRKNEFLLLFYSEFTEKETFIFFDTEEQARKYIDNCIKETLIWYEDYHGIVKTKYYNDNVKKLENVIFN